MANRSQFRSSRPIVGSRWIASRSPRFFLPVKVLGPVFCGKFLRGLRELHEAGSLRTRPSVGAVGAPASDAPTHDDFSALLRDLYTREWVVFCEAPPTTIAKNDPAPLVKYLARYVSGAAISDGRLLEHRRRARRTTPRASRRVVHDAKAEDFGW